MKTFLVYNVMDDRLVDTIQCDTLYIEEPGVYRFCFANSKAHAVFPIQYYYLKKVI